MAKPDRRKAYRTHTGPDMWKEIPEQRTEQNETSDRLKKKHRWRTKVYRRCVGERLQCFIREPCTCLKRMRTAVSLHVDMYDVGIESLLSRVESNPDWEKGRFELCPFQPIGICGSFEDLYNSLEIVR